MTRIFDWKFANADRNPEQFMDFNCKYHGAKDWKGRQGVMT